MYRPSAQDMYDRGQLPDNGPKAVLRKLVESAQKRGGVLGASRYEFRTTSPWGAQPFGIGAAGNAFGRYPTPVAGTNESMYMFGNEAMGMYKGLEFGPSGQLREFNPIDMLNESINAYMRTKGQSVSDRLLGFGVNKVTGTWAARHLQDLQATGGNVNIGNMPHVAGRRYLYWDNSTVFGRIKRAEELFMTSVLSSEDANPHTAFKELRQKYIHTTAEALRLHNPGGQLNLAGIKDVRYESLNGRTRLLVNTRGVDQLLPFGRYRNVVSAEHHYNQFIALKHTAGISKARMQPLVASSSYGGDLTMMARGLNKQVGSFGTVVRSDTMFLHGQGMGRLWNSIGGDSGILVNNPNVARAIGSSSGYYKKTITGIKGLSGIPDGTAQLSNELLGVLPGLADFLNDPEATKYVVNNPIQFNSKVLATYTGGKKLRAIKSRGIGDTIVGVEKTNSGRALRLIFNRSRNELTAGTPGTLSGVRGTFTGVKTGMKKSDLIAFGMKMDDPRVVRERYLSHYASRVAGIKNNRTINQNLQTMASALGLGYGETSNKLGYLHTGTSGAYSGAMGEAFDPGNVEKILAKAFGIAPSQFKVRSGAIRHKDVISMIQTGGGVSRGRAKEIYKQHLAENGRVYGMRFEGLSARVRASGLDRHTSRVRVSEAKLFMDKLQGFKSSADVRSMMDFVSSRITDVESKSKIVLTGLGANVEGTAAVNQFMEYAGGAVHEVKVTDLRKSGILGKMSSELSELGSLTPDTYSELRSMLGYGKGNVATVFDLTGSGLEGTELFSGARAAMGMGRNADAAFGTSNKVVLPSLEFLEAKLGKVSTTGLAGDMIFQRNAVRQGKQMSEFGGLSPFANVFSAIEEMINPDATAGSLSRRLVLATTSVRERVAGRKGMMGHSAVRGFKGGTYIAQASGEAGLSVTLSRAAIRNRFGGKKNSLGTKMIQELEAGRDVFAMVKRYPVQSQQQLIPVTVKLMEKGARARGVNYAEAMRVSALVAGKAQADFDADRMSLYMLDSNIDWNVQQRGIKQMWQAESKSSALFETALSQRFAKDTGFIDEVAKPYASVDKIIKGIYGEGVQIDDALRQSVGAWQRQMSGKYIGMVHSYAEQGQKVVAALTGGTNVFNLPPEELARIAKGVGLEGLHGTATADHVRMIYGFLKKGTEFSEATMGTVAALQGARKYTPGSKEWNNLLGRLSGDVAQMSEAFSGSGTAWYAMGDADLAAKYMVNGEIKSPEFYTHIADRMMRISRASGQLRRRQSATGLITGTRKGKPFLKQLMEETLGISMTARPNAASDEVISQVAKISVADPVRATTAAAVSGVETAINRATSLIDDFAGTKGWSSLKVGAGVAGAFAIMSAMSSKEERLPPQPVEIPSSPLPPPPQIGFPNDGANPSAIAPRPNVARINRTYGQRRHFGGLGPDQRFIPQGVDIMSGFNGRGIEDANIVGSVPTTLSEAEANNRLNRDF